MQVEILISGDIIVLPKDDMDALKKEIKDEISSKISIFKGNKITRKGMWYYLKNIDHEVAFDDEGIFEWRIKND